MKDKVIFYQMWSSELQHDYESELDKGNNQYVKAVCITENNKAFLEELECRMIDGYKVCDYWLRGLISSYVKKRAYELDTEYKEEYYNDWIDNTLWVISGKNYVAVEKWCENYRLIIKKELMKPRKLGIWAANA